MLLSCAPNNNSSSIDNSQSSENVSSETSNGASSENVSSEESSSENVSSEEISSEENSSEEESSEESSMEDSINVPDTADRLNPLNDPMISKQTYLHHVGNVFDAWEQYRGRGVTLAVIDSGFDYQHEEFSNADGTSKISEKSAYFYTNGSSTITEIGVNKVGISNGDSHGTFCAGVAAASVNGKGVVGIAPEADLMLLKVDKKPKSISEAFKYAADNGAKVITISIGSYYDYSGDLVNDGSDLATVFEDSIQYAHDKGVVICSAGGNGGECGMPTEYTFPGAYPLVIGCGGLAYNSSDYLWAGSSYNSSSEYQFIDIVAPGENLYNICNYSGKTYDGGWNGTSFSSPIVAGAACLYFEKYPTATNVDFENALYESAAKIEDDKHVGSGRLDIGALLNLDINNEQFTVKFETSSWWDSDGASTNMYLWNSVTKQTLNMWPGAQMTKNGEYYEAELSTSLYDSIIFVRSSPNGEFWGAQTIDISLSALRYCNIYSIKDSEPGWTNDGKVIEGLYR